MRRQLLLGAGMCALALGVLGVRGSWADLFTGFAPGWQVAIGLATGVLYAAGAWLGLRLRPPGATARHTIDSYRRLDLTGWNPLWIALAAGVGEELLFRGALQPWLGLWATCALFVLAHIRAYRMRTLDRRVLVQAGGLFGAGLALGLLAKYAGLLTAMIVHTAVDVVGLLVIRRLTRETP